MKNTKFITKLTNSINKAGFKLKKHSPEILIVAGVVGTVTSAVIACKATTKLNSVVNRAQEEIESIHDCANNEKMIDEYSQEDAVKDLAIVYIQTGIKVAKLYAPSVILGALSISGIIMSNNILRERNLAIAAAYATIDKTFKGYSNRVVERFGEEVDRELKYNINTKTVEEIILDPDTGKEQKTVEKEIKTVAMDGVSGYARFFDESCPYWDKDSEYNHMFLRAEQSHANDLLKANGYLFLNEVYKRLGLAESKAGQVVGWVYDPDDKNRDNYVDFGIYDANRERNRAFVNGDERSILLDFNVDGYIYDDCQLETI